MVKGRILRYMSAHEHIIPSVLTSNYSIDHAKKQVEMSFRTGDLARNRRPTLTLADLSEGQKVEGKVKKVEEYGLFIEIAGSKLSGLCHKSQVSLSFYVALSYLIFFRSRTIKTPTSPWR